MRFQSIIYKSHKGNELISSWFQSCMVLAILVYSTMMFSQQRAIDTIQDESFENIQALFENKIRSFERARSLVSLNEFLLSDFSDQEKNVLNTYKLKALVETDLLDEALNLANEMLLSSNLPPQMEIAILLERALLHEVMGDMVISKKDLNRIARIYDETFIPKDQNYGRYLYRLSSWYRMNDRKEESIVWAEKSRSYGAANNFKEVEASGYLLLGLNTDDKEIEDKRENFKKGLKIWKQDGIQPGVVNMYYVLAHNYWNENEFNEALIYNDSAIQLINNSKSDFYRPDIYKQRSLIFESQKSIDSALLYQKLFIKEELIALNKSRNLKVREYEYEFNKEKSVLQNIKLETQLEDANRKENVLIYGLIGATIFLLSLGFLFITLAARNRKINDQNSKIKVANYQLLQSLEEKEFLLQEVNHRVKNNLAFIQSLISFQMDETETLETVENLKSLNNRIQAIATVHDQFVESNHAMAHKEVPVKSYIAAIADALIQVNGDDVAYHQEIGNIKVNLETAVPLGIMINELITNSLKHARPESHQVAIDLKIHDNSDGLNVTYKDNGEAFIIKNDDQSLGLYIVKTMVKQLQGTIKRDGSDYSILVKRKRNT
ncbi:sensor histidine kinase [Nonlabens antarcticus]|uniref:sensor histidine kinase n=1 Tax=Nonlabens antarcticus TaxID=392714 RepID=UPI0018912553|nr:sensor histidine kinase [Nonlabens antarcticus]